MFARFISSKNGFFFLNLVIVLILWYRLEDPLPFFFIAGGICIISFFIKRAINQLIGE